MQRYNIHLFNFQNSMQKLIINFDVMAFIHLWTIIVFFISVFIHEFFFSSTKTQSETQHSCKTRA
jgi:hypothetical protein